MVKISDSPSGETVMSASVTSVVSNSIVRQSSSWAAAGFGSAYVAMTRANQMGRRWFMVISPIFTLLTV